MKEINPFQPDKKIKELSKKLNTPLLKLICELKLKIKFTTPCNIHEIEYMAREGRDAFYSCIATGASTEYTGICGSIWATFSAYYMMYKRIGPSSLVGVSELYQTFRFSGFGTSQVAEELQMMAYRGMMELSTTVAELAPLYNHLPAVTDFYQSERIVKSQLQSKLMVKLEAALISEIDNAKELAHSKEAYLAFEKAKYISNINAVALEKWKERSMSEFRNASTKPQWLNVYENSPSGSEAQQLALQQLLTK